MSTSPLPPDPYEALGVSKDADSDTVKKAHRKLVLKHHPDRIKDPALVEQGKNEFQKVQQAYELLIDPLKRQRYDDQVKLAQLRKERMMNDRMSEREAPPSRPTYTRTMYSARPSPAPTQPVQREMKPEPRYAYEERAPESYFDRVYEEPMSRANARKDPYEKRPSVSKPVEKRKEEKKSSAWEKPAAGMSFKAAFGLKEKAQSAKQKVKQQETRRGDAKARDKEERRERSEKQTYARYAPRVDDYLSESSDSDTVVAPARGGRDSRARSPRPNMSRTYSPEPMARPRASRAATARPRSPEPISRARSPQPKQKRYPSAEPPRRREPSPSDDSSDSDDAWKGRHQSANAYIAQSRTEARKPAVRPPLSRQGSESVYWAAEIAARDQRRSGSDSDRTHSANPHRNPRRTMAPETPEPHRRPPLQPHSSAPAGVKAAARTLEREPPVSRSRQGSYDARSPHHRNQMFGEVTPPLQRTSSDPAPPRTGINRRDTAPNKGSTLKETQTHQHDSGYGSSSTPHTPEMRSDSPQRPRETKTTYRARKDEGETHRARKMTDDGGDIRKFLSPDMAETQYQASHAGEEKRERRSSRSRDPEPRKRSPDARRRSPEPPRARSSRPTMAERRPSFNRAESSSRYEEQRPRKAMADRSPSTSFFHNVDPKAVRYASHTAPSYATYDNHNKVGSAFGRMRGEGRKVTAGY